jgi:hypothetical protein
MAVSVASFHLQIRFPGWNISMTPKKYEEMGPLCDLGLDKRIILKWILKK